MLVAKKPILIAMVCVLLASDAIWGQQQPPQTGDVKPEVGAQGAATRDDILQSTTWRKLKRSFDDWLSVQQLYTEEQVAKFKVQLERRIASMSAVELEDFAHDAEERLAILLSEKAQDARDYLSVFTKEGIRKRLPGGEIPNVFDMSTYQLRRELMQFEKNRASRSAANAAFSQHRQDSVDAARQYQHQRDQQSARAKSNRDYSTAQQRSTSVSTHYAPRRDPPPKPRFTVGPGGGIWRSLP